MSASSVASNVGFMLAFLQFGSLGPVNRDFTSAAQIQSVIRYQKSFGEILEDNMLNSFFNSRPK